MCSAASSRIRFLSSMRKTRAEDAGRGAARGRGTGSSAMSMRGGHGEVLVDRLDAVRCGRSSGPEKCDGLAVEEDLARVGGHARR